MTVISHIRHLIRAEAVGFGDRIEFTSLSIAHDESIAFFHFHLKVIAQDLRLGGISQNGIFNRCLQRLHRYDVGLNTGKESGIGMFLQLHGGDSSFLNLIDIIIVDHKLQGAVLLEDLHHLAFEGVFPTERLQIQFAISALLQP